MALTYPALAASAALFCPYVTQGFLPDPSSMLQIIWETTEIMCLLLAGYQHFSGTKGPYLSSLLQKHTYPEILRNLQR